MRQPNWYLVPNNYYTEHQSVHIVLGRQGMMSIVWVKY